MSDAALHVYQCPCQAREKEKQERQIESNNARTNELNPSTAADKPSTNYYSMRQQQREQARDKHLEQTREKQRQEQQSRTQREPVYRIQLPNASDKGKVCMVIRDVISEEECSRLTETTPDSNSSL